MSASLRVNEPASTQSERHIARVAGFRADTALFGALPELDSMAVAGLLTELEDRLGIVIDDDDLDGDLLGTFGALADYAVAKVGD